MATDKTKQIIGRKVLVDFPQLNLNGVIAKVDTGAYRGTLHCRDFKRIQRDGKKYIQFTPLDIGYDGFKPEPVLIEKYSRAWVKASSGHNQKRFVIETDIIIQGKQYPIEITLSSRKTMRSPVLLGRKFLRRRFIVDVDREALKPRRTT